MKFAKVLSVFGALALGAAITGCLNDSGPSSNGGNASLVVQAGIKDVNKVNGMAKTSVITLNKLVITLTSSDVADAVIRDTIIAHPDSAFKPTATSDQTFAKSIAVKPLRSWTVSVKTLDVNDSVIHTSTQLVSNLLVGETRAVTLNLTSKYVMYEAKFSLPDSLNFTQIGVKQQLSVNRVVMIVDGDTVVDSTRAPRFAISPTVNTVRFDYINVADTPDVKIEFFGRVGADTTVSKLFEYLFEDVDPGDETPNPPVQANYTGPNSSQLSAITGLTINIGKVGTVVFQPIIDPNVTTKKAVK